MPSYKNLCTRCGEDFASVKAFDRHRVGVHEYLFAEGMRMDPPREDGRRCLAPDEMLALKVPLRQDAKGRWSVTADAERVRRHHSRASDAQEATGV